jgi:hypothetical protein
MLSWLILLGLLFFIFFPNIGSQKLLATRYIRAVHPYSGLDPPTWEQFKLHIKKFESEPHVADAARHLYLAIESIRTLGLSIRRSDDHGIQEELDHLADRLSIEGEYELYTSAKKHGFYFFPRYLNDIPDEVTNVEKRGATIGDPGTRFPAPRRGGGSADPRQDVWGVGGNKDAIRSNGEAPRPLRTGGGL